MNSAADSHLAIPVSLSTGICDCRLVCVRDEGVVGVRNSWRPPAGHWVTDRWCPAPRQTSETLELIGNRRQEAIHTAGVNENRDRHVNKNLIYFLYLLYFL